ncbi:type I-E CRISPR-associated protein Cse2/CasB [Vreelandella sulfidaeris]|uniref:type I-E CRISPR-associated protein Cse2/CasB n=1 Tax=Vreelandella sulfidaeris TaxID=115553 RepID=UPI0035E8B6A7
MSDVVTPETSEKEELLTESEKKALVGLKRDEAAALRRWWQRLTLTPQELKALTPQPSFPRGVRAVLRRCDSADAAMLTQGFRELWAMLPEATKKTEYQEEQLQVWSCIALISAELRKEEKGVSLAKRLGQQKDSTGKPLMSELRFQQLLSCRTPEEFIQRLRRALALANKQDISVVLLASVIALWWREHRGRLSAKPTQRLGFVLANDYFAATSRYTHRD